MLIVRRKLASSTVAKIECVWNAPCSLEHFTVAKVNGKLQQCESGRPVKSTNTSVARFEFRQARKRGEGMQVEEKQVTNTSYDPNTKPVNGDHSFSAAVNICSYFSMNNL